MRILFSANAPWAHTGYGVQAQHLLPRLRALGHQVAHFAWYGLQGGVLESDGLRVYPAARDPWGFDIIGGHVAHWGADLVINMMDAWVLPADYAAAVRPARLMLWFPVDQAPLPAQVLERAQQADYAAVYSRFGQAQCQAAGLAADYVPCGVNTAVYRPGDQAEARRKLGFPEHAFIAVMVAANKGYPARKAFPEQLLAFAELRRTRPDALLYLHTAETSGKTDGIDIGKLLPACGIPADAVRWVDQYAYVLGLPESYLATVYQAADVLLGASYSEGFGIPLIEAQACGCPVITTDCTSMPELTVNGRCVPPVQPFWTWLHSWTAVPSVAGIAAALHEILEWAPDERAGRAHEGAEFVRTNYDWDVLAARHWQPRLDRIAEDIEE